MNNKLTFIQGQEQSWYDYNAKTQGYIYGKAKDRNSCMTTFALKNIPNAYCNGNLAFMINEMSEMARTEVRIKEAQIKMGTDKGVKLDDGKLRLGLVFGGFANGLKEVGAIGTFGANKYTDNGWQSVPNGVERYKDALLRHLFAWMSGEEYDQESGYRHLAHAGWNCLALLTLTHKPNFLKPIFPCSKIKTNGVNNENA